MVNTKLQGLTATGPQEGEMEKITMEHLQFVTPEGGIDEQWRQSRPVFDHFYNYLQNKGLTPKTIARKMNSVIIFTMNYMMDFDVLDNMTQIDGAILTGYLSQWDNFFPDSKALEKKAFRKAILDFFTFLKKKGLIDAAHLKEMKESSLEAIDYRTKEKKAEETDEEIRGLPALFNPPPDKSG